MKYVVKDNKKGFSNAQKLHVCGESLLWIEFTHPDVPCICYLLGLILALYSLSFCCGCHCFLSCFHLLLCVSTFLNATSAGPEEQCKSPLLSWVTNVPIQSEPSVLCIRCYILAIGNLLVMHSTFVVPETMIEFSYEIPFSAKFMRRKIFMGDLKHFAETIFTDDRLRYSQCCTKKILHT